jgi:acetone carboxylase gamma subunit
MGQQPFIKDGEFAGSVERDPNEACHHPNAEATGDTCHLGCCDEYLCPDCGKVFMVEVPD